METWMVFVGLSMTYGSIPQAYRIWKRKASDDISIQLWVLMVHGLVWWLIYGIYIGSVCLIVTNTVGLVLDVTVLFLCIKYRRG